MELEKKIPSRLKSDFRVYEWVTPSRPVICRQKCTCLENAGHCEGSEVQNYRNKQIVYLYMRI